MTQAQLSEELLLKCMRCGFCLPACPTYRHLEAESASPRGRISLLRAVQEGQLDLLDVAPKLDMCLGCRACEPACPAGVSYGQILEEGRAAIAQVRPTPWPMRFAYKHLLGKPAGIKLAGYGLWLYQKLGLGAVARRFRLVERVGGPGLAAMERAVPPSASPSRRAQRKRITTAAGSRKARVAFFTGCVSDIVFFETNQDAIAVLASAGCEVEITPGQGCCGAVHSHAGEHDLAVEQAKRNVAAFEQGGYDYIVNTAGGCGAALKEYGRLLAGDPAWADRAAAFSRRCRDFAELVSDLGPLPLGPLEGSFTYQDSCHLRNGQRVFAQPRNLLKAIPGARYVELPEGDRCCGAAGTYAITQFALSDEILDRKMENVAATQAATVVVANPPCQLEMIEGVQRAGLEHKVKVRHLAEVLAESLGVRQR